MKFAAFCLLLLCLTSCWRDASNPCYLTPVGPTKNWRSAPGQVEIPPWYLLTSCPVYQNKEAYASCCMSLSQLVELALTNSNLLKESFAETHFAAAHYGESLAPLFPEINAQYYFEMVREGSFFESSGIFNFLQSGVFVNQFKQFGPYASLSWLVFDQNATWERSEAMRQLLFRANWMHNRQIQTVIEQTTVDYYTYIGNKELLIAAEANLFDAETLLDSTLAKHKYGIADLSDELQAEAQVSRREVDLLISMEQMEDAKTQLVADLGIPANTDLCIEDPEKQIDLELSLPPIDDYIAEAYMYRPDLYAAFSKMCAAVWSVKAARDDQWFQLNLNGTYGRTNFQNGQSDIYDYTLQMTLSLPLFKGFAYLNRIREAKAELARTKAEMRQLEVDLMKEVTTYYQNLEISTEMVKVNLYYVKVAELAYKATLGKYRAGTVDYVTTVNSLTELADARNSLAQSKKDWYISLTDLAYSTGTLCK
jgi:outer membrane protein